MSRQNKNANKRAEARKHSDRRIAERREAKAKRERDEAFQREQNARLKVAS